jgi:hypothetical protein
MEAAHAGACLASDAAQFPNQFIVGTANHHGESFGGLSEGCNFRKVPGRDYDGPTVFHDERIGIPNRTAKRFDLSPGFAGAKH